MDPQFTEDPRPSSTAITVTTCWNSTLGWYFKGGYTPIVDGLTQDEITEGFLELRAAFVLEGNRLVREMRGE